MVECRECLWCGDVWDLRSGACPKCGGLSLVRPTELFFWKLAGVLGVGLAAYAIATRFLAR